MFCRTLGFHGTPVEEHCARLNAKATGVARAASTLTRQLITLESQSKHQQMQKVLSFRLK